MALWKRGSKYWMDVVINGERYREPLRTRDHREAKDKEKTRITEIQNGKVSLRSGRAFSRLPFCAAAACYLQEREDEAKKGGLSERTYQLERERFGPLRAYFGDRRVSRIAANDISAYQTARLEGRLLGHRVGSRTINMEVGVLRKVLKKAKRWTLIAEDVKMLREGDVEIARVLTSEQKQHLFRVAGSKTRWMVAHCAAVLAVSTTCRKVELRHVCWKDVDLFGNTLVIRRSKTDAGRRIIPLNSDALAALARLRDRAEKLGFTAPDHFVLFACECGRFDPTKPQKTWRTAWRSLTKKAGFKGLRFHDLRHQAVTELAEKGAPDATLMAIAGHMSRRMLEHYSHVRMAAKRDALDKIACGGLIEETVSKSEAQNPARVN